MISTKITALMTCVSAAALLASCTPPAPPKAPPESARQSSPSVYEGYSDARFDGHERSSFYIPMRDGTRLAADLFRPTLNGDLVDESFPVVWMHSPYNRRTFRGEPAASAYPGYALQLVGHGYNVAIVDFRGLYASFGTNIGFNRGEWVEAARWDAYDVTEWFADQPYSNGNIGMWGCSATGGSQMQALTVAPPSLKAVVPMSAELDAYAFAVNGGVARQRPIAPPGATPGRNMVQLRDTQAVAVDGPDAEAELEAARAEHAGNIDSVGYVPNRDSISEATGLEWWDVSSSHTYLDTLQSNEIGVLSVANWEEAGTRHGPFFTFNNLNADFAKLLVGPATHCDWTTVKNDTGFDLVTEELRFYDYWLKGIQNNVMSEPAVTYYTYNAEGEGAFRQSDVWPLEDEVRTPYYLTSYMTLDANAPGRDFDIATTLSEPPSAETVTISPPQSGIFFQSSPLDAALEVTGHPVISFWMESEAPDVDVTAFLFDVAPDGTATTYQMLGRLRASHRAIAEAPYDNLGLPWHSFRSTDAAPIPAGEPVEITFDMLPMSYEFAEEHQIRLQLSFADPTGQDVSSEIILLTGESHPAMIELPIVPTR